MILTHIYSRAPGSVFVRVAAIVGLAALTALGARVVDSAKALIAAGLAEGLGRWLARASWGEA